MNNINKVKPEEVKGTISLPNKPSVKINKQAVPNNGSERTGKEFINSLKEASKKALFPQTLNQNGSY